MAVGLSSIVESPRPERLASGFKFTEGPLWHPDGYWLFVDIVDQFIIRMTPAGEHEVFRRDSNGANGMTFDLDGRLLACEGLGRAVTRRGDDGSFTPIADRWDDKRLNRPNDVVTRSDGAIYFTDPEGRLDEADREQGFSGVYRIAPDGAMSLEIDDIPYPNGLAFSPDERVLYVANTRPHGRVMTYDVSTDGAVSNGRSFVEMTSDGSRGIPDGMKVDVEGRLYATGPGGCWVVDPGGEVLGVIEPPELPANCAWGGPDNRTMLFTARTSVYALRMTTPGTPVPRR